VVVLRKRSSREEQVGEEDESPVVSTAHALIQRGLSAQRALVELTRSYPNDVASLAELDASVFTDERYPLFKTKAGRRRFEELQALLSPKSNDDTLLGADLAEVLSQSISNQTPPDQVASSICGTRARGRVGGFFAHGPRRARARLAGLGKPPSGSGLAACARHSA